MKKIQHMKKIAILIVFIAVVTFIIVGALFHWPWTGFDKPLYDWMQLLIVPIALAWIAIWFNRIEHKNEQTVTTDNQQEAALQGYLDRMSELILEKGLRKSKPKEEVRNVARVRTITILHQLNTERINHLFSFLRESGLLICEGSTNEAIINFSMADLRNVDFSGTNLSNMVLGRVNFSGANLSYSYITEVDFTLAILIQTNLQGALLMGCDFRGAKLTKSNLKYADLSGANLNGVELSQADLTRASFIEVDFTYSWFLEANFREADLRNANFTGANLQQVNFTRANLQWANFTKARLQGANFTGANLQEVNFTEANLQGANFKGTIFSKTPIEQISLDKNAIAKKQVTQSDISTSD